MLCPKQILYEMAGQILGGTAALKIVGGPVITAGAGAGVLETVAGIVFAAGAVGGGGSGAKGDGTAQSKSRINENDRLAKEAEKMGKDPKVQKEADELIEQYKNGNTNPGLGSKHLQGDIYYLRGRNGARVFYRMKDGVMEILGKASKSNEQTVIDLVIEILGK